jgi:hypothetical protein
LKIYHNTAANPKIPKTPTLIKTSSPEPMLIDLSKNLKRNSLSRSNYRSKNSKDSKASDLEHNS